MASERSNAQRTKVSPWPALLRRARLRNRCGVPGPCGASGNAGVQGGTGSSNLLCSSGESDANLSLIQGTLVRSDLALTEMDLEAVDIDHRHLRRIGPADGRAPHELGDKFRRRRVSKSAYRSSGPYTPPYSSEISLFV
jgi:hypothetical protein